jgi:predicted nucleic acid-binding protein
MPARALSAITAGSRVLLDANIFIYAFTGRSVQCREILERSQEGDVAAVTTIEAVNEVCHKLMLLEALERGVIDRISAAALRSKAAQIVRLTTYWKQVERIFDLNIEVLGLAEARARRAHQLRSVLGLLTNDSLIAAAAQEQAIANLATSDRDFDRINWLSTYRPTDLPR